VPLEEEYIKKHFSTEGTVSRWWEPESIDPFLVPKWLRQFYIQQRFILRSIFDVKGKAIIDIGTGKGRFAIDLALAGAKQIHSIDVSKDMLKIAKKRATQVGVADRIIFVEGDAEHLPFKDCSFNVAVCMETFCHLPNPQHAMNEIARIIRQNGMVIANMITSGKLWRLRYRHNISIPIVLAPVYFSRFVGWLRPFFHQKLGYPLNPSKPLARYFSQRSFHVLFTNAGLQIFKVIKQGPRYSPVFITVVGEKILSA